MHRARASLPSTFSRLKRSYLDSLRGLDLHALYAILYELAFVLSCWALWAGHIAFIGWERGMISSMNLEPQPLTPELVQATSQGITSFVAAFGLGLAVFGALLALLYCLFNSLVWARLTGNPPTTAWAWRWVKTTLPAALVLELLFVVMTVAFKPEAYTLTVPVWFFLSLYLMTSLHLTLATNRDRAGRKAWASALHLAAGGCLTILLPTAAWLATYIPITFLLGIVVDMTRTEILAPYLIVMTVWLRRYLLVYHPRNL